MVTLGGAILIVYNSETSEEETVRITALGSASFITYLLLFSEPFMFALGQVLNRKLRKLSNITVTIYSNLACIFVFFFWCVIAEEDLNAWSAYDSYDWIALITSSIFLVFAQILYFMSL